MYFQLALAVKKTNSFTNHNNKSIRSSYQSIFQGQTKWCQITGWSLLNVPFPQNVNHLQLGWIQELQHGSAKAKSFCIILVSGRGCVDFCLILLNFTTQQAIAFFSPG
jgi:hypothetical protein